MKKSFMILIALTALIAAAMCFALTGCATGSESDDAAEAGEHYQAEDMEAGTVMGPFASTDLDGRAVTDAVFAEKDVTILNVWATYCGPCLEEMPELSELDKELPENAQIIGMVIDAPDEDAAMMETAREMCDDAGVSYINIAMNDSMSGMLSSVEAVPTTFIVDSSGKTVCVPIVGADVESYRRAALEYLDQMD